MMDITIGCNKPLVGAAKEKKLDELVLFGIVSKASNILAAQRRFYLSSRNRQFYSFHEFHGLKVHHNNAFREMNYG